ncbi:hypothetical protein BsWGS_07891 [Bradybaena similaris]
MVQRPVKLNLCHQNMEAVCSLMERICCSGRGIGGEIGQVISTHSCNCLETKSVQMLTVDSPRKLLLSPHALLSGDLSNYGDVKVQIKVIVTNLKPSHMPNLSSWLKLVAVEWGTESTDVTSSTWSSHIL